MTDHSKPEPALRVELVVADPEKAAALICRAGSRATRAELEAIRGDCVEFGQPMLKTDLTGDGDQSLADREVALIELPCLFLPAAKHRFQGARVELSICDSPGVLVRDLHPRVLEARTLDLRIGVKRDLRFGRAGKNDLIAELDGPDLEPSIFGICKEGAIWTFRALSGGEIRGHYTLLMIVEKPAALESLTWRLRVVATAETPWGFLPLSPKPTRVVEERLSTPWPSRVIRRPPDGRHVLHLSDLHFGGQEDATLWAGQLAEDLRHELGITSLHGLLVSGDISERAKVDEFRAAASFLDAICDEFSVHRDQVAVVPGNHDVDWTTTDPKHGAVAYRLVERAACDRRAMDLGQTYESDPGALWIRDDAAYQNRFLNFAALQQALKAKPYPLDPARQYTIHRFTEPRLLVLGLNSAWQIDHHFRDRVGLHPCALERALGELRRQDNDDFLKIALLHHPPAHFREDGIVERLAVAGFRILLHGHVHRSEAAAYRHDMFRDGRRIDLIGAGTFGAPTSQLSPALPWQYNLLTFSHHELVVSTRRREKSFGPWMPDARWLQGPGRTPLDLYSCAI